jgi:hypothetical protein
MYSYMDSGIIIVSSSKYECGVVVRKTSCNCRCVAISVPDDLQTTPNQRCSRVDTAVDIESSPKGTISQCEFRAGESKRARKFRARLLARLLHHKANFAYQEIRLQRTPQRVKSTEMPCFRVIVSILIRMCL